MRGMPVNLFKINARNKISRDMTLEEIAGSVNVERLRLDYDDYITPMVLWATEDSTETAKALQVVRVVPMGGYIRGLFGGEDKKGKQKYAGLVVEHYEESNGIIYVKLHNLTKSYQVPVDLMRRYGVSVYKLYYRGLINPFVCRTYNVLLSAKGDEKLKAFISNLIDFNQNVMSEEDAKNLNTLINELKTSIDMFKENYYVVYRCQRIFTACVPTDLRMAISESHVAYLECRDLEQAYYYVATLNYLAYKVIKTGRSFIRDQFARPAIAVAVAGLSWKIVPEDIRAQMACLSMQLAKKLTWKDYPDQKIALMELAQHPEFKEIVRVFDEVVDEKGLNEALNLVSSISKERTKDNDN